MQEGRAMPFLRTTAPIFVSPGNVPSAITLNVIWMNSMLANCLAACAHLSITVSEIQRDICEKIVILSYPLHSTPL